MKTGKTNATSDIISPYYVSAPKAAGFRTAWTNEVFHAMIMGPIYNQDMQGWVHLSEQSVRIR